VFLIGAVLDFAAAIEIGRSIPLERAAKWRIGLSRSTRSVVTINETTLRNVFISDTSAPELAHRRGRFREAFVKVERGRLKRGLG
jgi:hypothetical protein